MKKEKQPHGGALVRPEKGVSMNPNGRPPKLVSMVVAELKEKGYERATAGTVAEAFEVMMNLPIDVVQEMANDKTQSIAVRIVAKAMMSNKGWDVLNAMLDRAHGKAKQINESTGPGGGPLQIQIINADTETESGL